MKTITLKELTEYLETFLMSSTFTDYCPNGLQVEGKNEIKKVAVAVTASLSTIEKCVREGCDALIVHHGLFWQGDPFPITGSKRKKLELLLANNISLLAYHLPLDAHKSVGNNWKAAGDLGWNDLAPFGIGVKGTFPPIAFSAFVEKLERYYGQKAFVAPGGPDKVASAALISGGGYKELRTAKLAGVDAFITGNFDEPAWWVAQEEKIHFLALGHTSTEKVGPKALAIHLKEQWGIDSFYMDEINPF